MPPRQRSDGRPAETTEPLQRAGCCRVRRDHARRRRAPAGARSACRRAWTASRAGYESAMLAAMVAQARGAVELAEGDARAALVSLRQRVAGVARPRRAVRGGRARVLLGLACRALGDDDTAAMELEAARAAFRRAGGGARPRPPRRARARPPGARPHGLTPVSSRCCAWSPPAGPTRRSPPSSSSASARSTGTSATSSAKLGVSSRAAATAYAYEHQLV